jgi:hypothetical protein
MQFFKKKFVVVQLILIVLIGLVVAMGDRSAPKLALEKKQLQATSPVVVSFSRPVERKSFESNFSLTRQGQVVNGIFSWSSRSVAFIPDSPLLQGEVYTVAVKGVTDTNGQVQRGELRTELRVASPRFLYITALSELALGNPNGESKKFTGSEGEVLSYAVKADGSQAIVSLKDKNGYRLEKISLESGERKVLSASQSYYYQHVSLCGSEADFVAYKKQLDQKQTVVASSLVTASFAKLERLALDERELVGSSKLGTTDVLSCTPYSRQVVYRSIDGSLLVLSLSEPSEAPTSLGIYQRSYGFSAAGDALLLGLNTTNDYPILRAIFSFDNQGKREKLSEEAFDTTDASLSYLQLLAYSQDREVGGEAAFSSTMQLVVSSTKGGAREVTLFPTQAGVSDERPRWSVDGKYLSFERLVTDTGSAERPQDSLGRLLDGEIWVQELPSRDGAIFQPSPKATGLFGGNVTWLP